MRKSLPRVLLVFFFFLACQSSEDEKIFQTLKRREEAFQKKDLSLYLSCISSNYQDKNGDFDGLKARMEGYFKTFDRIEYSSWDRSLHVSGDEAAVVQQFQMVVELGEKKNRYSGKEFLFLKKEGGTWKIYRGL